MDLTTWSAVASICCNISLLSDYRGGGVEWIVISEKLPHHFEVDLVKDLIKIFPPPAEKQLNVIGFTNDGAKVHRVAYNETKTDSLERAATSFNTTTCSGTCHLAAALFSVLGIATTPSVIFIFAKSPIDVRGAKHAADQLKENGHTLLAMTESKENVEALEPIVSESYNSIKQIERIYSTDRCEDNNTSTQTPVSTTQTPTTPEPTTTESTTMEQTTTECTSTEPTISESTTECTSTEPTISESTTECTSTEPTISESTTECTSTEPTISESTTMELSTTECTSTEPTISESTTECTSTEPTISESTTMELSTTECTSTEPTISESTTECTSTEPTISESTTECTSTEPTISESTTMELSTTECTSTEPTISESTTECTSTEPTISESTTEYTSTEPTISQSTTMELTTTEYTSTEPTISESTTMELSTTESTSTEQTISQSKTPKPTTTESTTSKSTITKSTAPEPTTTESYTAPTITESQTSQPIKPVPSTTKLTTLKSTTPKLTTPAPIITESQTSKPTKPVPSTTKLTTLKSTTPKLTTPAPTITESQTSKPTKPVPSTTKLTTLKSTTPKLTTPAPTITESQTSELTIPDQTVTESITFKPTTAESTSEELSTTKSTPPPSPTCAPPQPPCPTCPPQAPEPPTPPAPTCPPPSPPTCEPPTPSPPTCPPPALLPPICAPPTPPPPTCEPPTPPPPTCEPQTPPPPTCEPQTPPPPTCEPPSLALQPYSRPKLPSLPSALAPLPSARPKLPSLPSSLAPLPSARPKLPSQPLSQAPLPSAQFKKPSLPLYPLLSPYFPLPPYPPHRPNRPQPPYGPMLPFSVLSSSKLLLDSALPPTPPPPGPLSPPSPGSLRWAADCAPLVEPPNGQWTPPSCSRTSLCSLVCSPGYATYGSTQLRCVNGSWNGLVGPLNTLLTCHTMVEVAKIFYNQIVQLLGNQTNILYVLSEADSAQPQIFGLKRLLLQGLVNALRLTDRQRVGLVSFTTLPNVEIPLEVRDPCEFSNAVQARSTTTGGRDIAAALTEAYYETLRTVDVDSNKTLILLITDGIPTSDPTEAASLIRNSGHTLYTIGIGNAVDEQHLLTFSTDLDGNPYYLRISQSDTIPMLYMLAAVAGNNITCLPSDSVARRFQTSTSCSPLPAPDRGAWYPDTCTQAHIALGQFCHMKCLPEYKRQGGSPLVCRPGGWTDTKGGDTSIPWCSTTRETSSEFAHHLHSILGRDQYSLVFIMHASDSTAATQGQLDLIKTVVRAFPLSDNYTTSLVVFYNNTQVTIPITTSDTCVFLHSLDQIASNGDPAGFETAIADIDLLSSGQRKLVVIVLVTAAETTGDAWSAVEQIKAQENLVLEVGVDDNMSLSSTDARYSVFRLEDFPALTELTELLKQRLPKKDLSC